MQLVRGRYFFCSGYVVAVVPRARFAPPVAVILAVVVLVVSVLTRFPLGIRAGVPALVGVPVAVAVPVALLVVRPRVGAL